MLSIIITTKLLTASLGSSKGREHFTKGSCIKQLSGVRNSFEDICMLWAHMRKGYKNNRETYLCITHKQYLAWQISCQNKSVEFFQKKKTWMCATLKKRKKQKPTDECTGFLLPFSNQYFFFMKSSILSALFLLWQNRHFTPICF